MKNDDFQTWHERQASFLAANPECADCKAEHRWRTAEYVHWDLTEGKLLGLCDEHHFARIGG